MKIPTKYPQLEIEVKSMVEENGDVRLAVDTDYDRFYAVYINDLEYHSGKDTNPSYWIADFKEYHIALSLAIALGQADNFEMFNLFKPEDLNRNDSK